MKRGQRNIGRRRSQVKMKAGQWSPRKCQRRQYNRKETQPIWQKMKARWRPNRKYLRRQQWISQINEGRETQRKRCQPKIMSQHKMNTGCQRKVMPTAEIKWRPGDIKIKWSPIIRSPSFEAVIRSPTSLKIHHSTLHHWRFFDVPPIEVSTTENLRRNKKKKEKRSKIILRNACAWAQQFITVGEHSLWVLTRSFRAFKSATLHVLIFFKNEHVLIKMNMFLLLRICTEQKQNARYY